MKTDSVTPQEAAGAGSSPSSCSAVWFSVSDKMPDSDLTVMVHHPEEDEPVWLGYHDGETWRLVDGARCNVTHWADLPKPPNGITLNADNLRVRDADAVEVFVADYQGQRYSGSSFANIKSARAWIALQPNRASLRVAMTAKFILPNA